MSAGKSPSGLFDSSHEIHKEKDQNLRRRLVHLRTKGEVEASNAIVDVFIIEIPTKSTGAIIELLRPIVPSKELQAIQHLRRIIKPEFLPTNLRPHGLRGSSTASEDGGSQLSTVFLLIGPTACTDFDRLTDLFAGRGQLLGGLKPRIQTIAVPALAPVSAEQANDWTEKYWPTVFKNTNPYGPHPSMVRRAELELLTDGGPEAWLDLARGVAEESAKSGEGLHIGAVILSRNDNNPQNAVVAVAGDARWHNSNTQAKSMAVCDPGNVIGHAVMRAIGMVARKRLLIADDELKGWPSAKEGKLRSPLLDLPLTPLEEEYFKQETLVEGGYLCLDLELYVTHEPCVMCSMAILHSRFGRVIFGQRMSATGAMTAEGDGSNGDKSLGYGLFWRPVELNWRLLCWQYLTKDNASDHSIPDEVHA